MPNAVKQSVFAKVWGVLKVIGGGTTLFWLPYAKDALTATHVGTIIVGGLVMVDGAIDWVLHNVAGRE